MHWEWAKKSPVSYLPTDPIFDPTTLKFFTVPNQKKKDDLSDFAQSVMISDAEIGYGVWSYVMGRCSVGPVRNNDGAKKKKICVFTVACWKKLGSVGRK